MKGVILVAATIGSILGAYLPNLWGDSNGLGGMSLLLGTIGGIAGVVIGWKIANNMGE